MIIHPWHAVPCGPQAPQIVNAVIEIPRGSRAKYEIDNEWGMLRLDRILMTSISYPFPYGFIPQTLADDGDALDILVLCSEPLAPLTVVETRVLGIMQMIDQNEKDYKIIGVATGDHTMRHIHELVDLPNGTLEDIRCFSATIKKQKTRLSLLKGFPEKKRHTILLNKDANLIKNFVQH